MIKIRISEIFKTIQGESSFAGLPTVMVRMTGCNLRCVYCDTQHAYDGGEELLVDELFRKIDAFHCPLISITGGEPLLQEGLYPLTEKLVTSTNTIVLVETSGSRDISKLHKDVRKIMDIKCPDSGMDHTFLWKNIEHVKKLDEIKFVLSSKRDYRWALQVVADHALHNRCQVIFSPVTKRLEPAQLAQWMITQDNQNIRLQLQLHKVIGCK